MPHSEKQRDIGLAVLKGVACLIVFFEHFMECFMIYDLADQPNYRLANIVYFLPLKIFTFGRVANFTFCLLSGYFASGKSIDSIKELIRCIACRYIRLVLILLGGTLLLGICFWLGITPVASDAVAMLNDNLPMFRTDFSVIISAFAFRSLNFAMWIVKYIFFGNVCVYVCSYILQKFRESKKWIISVYLVLTALLIVLDHGSYGFEMVILTMLGVPLYLLVSVKDQKMRLAGRCIWIAVLALAYCITSVDLTIECRYLSYIGAVLFILGFKYLFAGINRNLIVRYLSDYPIAVWTVHPVVIYTICLKYFNGSSLQCDYKLGIAFVIALGGVFVLSLLYKRTFEKVCDKIYASVSTMIGRILGLERN